MNKFSNIFPKRTAGIAKGMLIWKSNTPTISRREIIEKHQVQLNNLLSFSIPPTQTQHAHLQTHTNTCAHLLAHRTPPPQKITSKQLFQMPHFCQVFSECLHPVSLQWEIRWDPQAKIGRPNNPTADKSLNFNGLKNGPREIFTKSLRNVNMGKGWEKNVSCGEPKRLRNIPFLLAEATGNKSDRRRSAAAIDLTVLTCKALQSGAAALRTWQLVNVKG